METQAGAGETNFVHRLLHARDFQGRDEFERVIEWWRKGRGGVCALVGIGGAGKTAIMERFLRMLPGGLEPDGDLAKDETLATPGRVMVFSFFDAPNPQVFFAHLHAWLSGAIYDETASRPSYHQTLDLLTKLRPGGAGLLLCLDGLEKVQNDGLRGGTLGELKDYSLRDFVSRIADGWQSKVKMLITSRFPIASLEEEEPANYFKVPVDDLSEDAAVALLQKRGVMGDRGTLERLANYCGRHALTLDLVGGYLKEFRNGNPAARPEMPSPSEIQAAILKEPNPRRRRFLNQSLRLARIEAEYREALQTHDPAALALLERICLFRLPASPQMLGRIFLGVEKRKISGPELAGLSQPELEQKLELLSQMRLIENSGSGEYSIHPAIRDGFLRGFDTRDAREGHEAARQFLELQLGEKPGKSPDLPEPENLDLLEEIIYHTLEAGDAVQAYDLYSNKAKGPLAALSGDLQRVDRICRVLSSAEEPQLACIPEGVLKTNGFDMLMSWGIALVGLGQLRPAIACYERADPFCEDDNRGAVELFSAEAMLLSGRIAQAASLLELSSEIYLGNDRQGSFMRTLARYPRMLLGDDYPADEPDLGQLIQGILGETDGSPIFAFMRGDWVLHMMMEYGEVARAADLGSKVISDLKERQGYREHQTACKLYSVMAEAALRSGNLAEARDYERQLSAWAMERDHKEMICASALIAARIALTEAASQPSPAALIAGAVDRLNQALYIVRDCGYSLLHIDLLNQRALARLMQGSPVEAEADARMALLDGLHPKAESGLPELLAATDPECKYLPGEMTARLRLAEALLLQAKAGAPRQPLVAEAVEQLYRLHHLQERLGSSAVGPTERMLRQIDAGWLSDYSVPSPARRQTSPGIASRRIQAMEPPADFVIITPLEEERDAMLRKLPGYRKLPPRKEDIRVYFSAEVPVEFADGSDGRYKVVVVPLTDMGQQEAATATSDALRYWNPRFVLLVGIAGGLRKAGVNVGDILISDQVADYELQKITQDATRIRWRVNPVNKQLLLASNNMIGDAWMERLQVKRPGDGLPKRKRGVICTGNKVIANGLLDEYKEVWDRLIGVEMEAGGVAAAACSSIKAPGFFMIRSASDLADKEKDSPDTSQWREYACDAAAAYAIALLSSGPVVCES